MRRRPHEPARVGLSRTAPWLALALALAAPSVSCSSASSDLSSQPGCLGSLANCEVSFARDVVPNVFAVSCAFSECHTSTTAPKAGLYLGPNVHDTQGSAGAAPPYYPPEGPTFSQIHASLLAPSTVAASMPRVDPGKPETSFLMHKLDADLTTAQIACTPTDVSISGCGKAMPQNGQLLPIEMREVVRAWIAQGAKAN